MKSFIILIFGVGIAVSTNMLLGQPSENQKDFLGQTSSKREWIGEWRPSNKKTKVFIDGDHTITIHPERWKYDSQGNIYIRKDKTQQVWKENEDEDEEN